MVLSAYAQKSTSVKTFEYPDYLCPNPYTGKPIYGGSTLEVSHSEKKNSYGIEFRYGYVKYSLSLSYKGMDNGLYVYTGFEIGNMTEAVVMSSTKLSRFLNNYGQVQNETFEEDKLIEVHISGSGSLSVYPIKDTPESRKRIEEKTGKQEAENAACNKLEELYPYGVAYLQDSLKQQVIKEFFDNGGEVKSFNLEPYSFHTYVAVIDTNKQVTVIQKDEAVLNDELQNEQLHGEIEYKPLSMEGKTAKVINGKVFFSMSFYPKLEVQEHKAVVVYNKKEFFIFYLCITCTATIDKSFHLCRHRIKIYRSSHNNNIRNKHFLYNFRHIIFLRTRFAIHTAHATSCTVINIFIPKKDLFCLITGFCSSS